MPKRATADLPFRSGRFKKLAATTQRIVRTFDKAAEYRFFNTAKKEFTVTAKTDSGSTTTLLVKKQCSVDILVRANSTVTISGTPLAQIEGVYDLVAKGVPVRSGRFKASGLHVPTDALQVVRGRVGDLYRIFNVGETPFVVGVNSVIPGCSTDFALQVPDPLTISTDVNVSVAGVYDSLDTGLSVRSGHFKLDVDADPDINKELEHLVVDATGSSKALRYRITNSGTGALAFNVIADGAELVKLLPDQSIDLVAGPGSGADPGYKQIKVTRIDKTILVNGIYDFLGEE